MGGLSIVGLMWWYSGSAAVTAAVIAGLLVVMGLGFIAARSLLSGGRRVGGFAGSIWRVALAGLQRRGRANALQMVICYGDYVDAAPVGGAVLAHRSVARRSCLRMPQTTFAQFGA